MKIEDLQALVAELAPLVGSRCQRVDVIDDGELCLELRAPGRTLRLLVVARTGGSRVHLVRERPLKRQTPGALQGLLRKRLEGRALEGLEVDVERRALVCDFAGTRLSARLGAGKRAFELAERAPLPAEERQRFKPLPESFPISEALEASLGERAARDTIERLRRAELARIDAATRRARRLIERLEGDARGLERHAGAGRDGELLKTVLHQIRRGQRSVTVVDYSSGEPVERELALDGSLEPKAQLERLFAKHKRAERGLPQVARRREEAMAELERLAAERARVLAADEEGLAAFAREASDAPEPSRAEGPKGELAPIDRCSRRFVTLGGFEVRVGRGARENDRLSFAMARGHDLWLHARGIPGAHVLLRLAKGQVATEDALIDAAHLAAHFSSGRGEPKLEVVVTEARYVRKTKGAPAGQVSLSRERTLLLRVEPARLTRLLGT